MVHEFALQPSLKQSVANEHRVLELQHQFATGIFAKCLEVIKSSFDGNLGAYLEF